MIGMRLIIVQHKTARTRILEYLRAPFGGKWLGEPGFLPVKAIAAGADVSVRHARKVLAALAAKGDVRQSAGRRKLYAAAALGGSDD